LNFFPADKTEREESDCDPQSKKLNETATLLQDPCAQAIAKKTSPPLSPKPKAKKLAICMEFEDSLCACMAATLESKVQEKQRPMSCGPCLSAKLLNDDTCGSEAVSKKGRRPSTFCSSLDLLAQTASKSDETRHFVCECKCIECSAVETPNHSSQRVQIQSESCDSFQLDSNRERCSSKSCGKSPQPGCRPSSKAESLQRPHPSCQDLAKAANRPTNPSNCLNCGSLLLTAKSSSVSLRICFKCIEKEKTRESETPQKSCMIQKAIDSKKKQINELCMKSKQAERCLLGLTEERERLDEKACQLKLCRCCRSDGNQTDDALNDEEFCRNLDAVRTVDGMIRNKIDGIKSIKQQVKELQEEIDAMKKC
jgi:hypothetical protein